MHHAIRATASAWPGWRCSIAGARPMPERHAGETVFSELDLGCGLLDSAWVSGIGWGGVGMPRLTTLVGVRLSIWASLSFGAGEADLESFDLAEPAFAFGFGDAGGEVVADLDQAVALGGVGPEHRAADAGVFVDAGGAERAAAGADGDLAAFEVAEELLPFLVGGTRYSSLGRSARRRARNARWAWMASSG